MRGGEAEKTADVQSGPVVAVGAVAGIEVALGPGPVKAERWSVRSERIAVTPAGNDDIAAVLRRLGLRFEAIQDPDLGNAGLLARFATVFLNCSAEAVPHAGTYARALAEFVASGGSLYASDWAGAHIQAAFPHVFHGDQSGHAGRLSAAVVPQDIQRLLGAEELELHFDMPSWYRVTSFRPENARGDVYLAEARTPLMLAFKHGRGQVLFTSFHNRAQPSDMVDKLLKFLVLVPVVGNARVATHVVELAGGNLQRYGQLRSGQ